MAYPLTDDPVIVTIPVALVPTEGGLVLCGDK